MIYSAETEECHFPSEAIRVCWATVWIAHQVSISTSHFTNILAFALFQLIGAANHKSPRYAKMVHRFLWRPPVRSDSIVHGHANPALNSLNVNEVSRTLPVSPRDSDWFCPISFNYHSHGHFKPFWSIACSLSIATTSSCVQKTSCVLDWLKPLQIPHSRTATIFGSGARMLRALQTSS